MKIVALVLLLVCTSRLFSESNFYDVQKNDTLWSISRRFGVQVEDLKAANGISDERSLRVGMRLIIPASYVVEKGDTLWSIARKHETTVDVLRELNKLQSNSLDIGDVLLVPESVTGGTGGTNATAQNDSAASGNGDNDGADSSAAANTGGMTSSGTSGGSAAGAVPFWPHAGSRSARTGKLSGTEFTGSQGDDVFTISSGEVVWNAPNRGYGNIIIIESNDNYLYLYTGLAETLVSLGDRVQAGAKIAELGIDPHTGEAKLLLSVYKNGKRIDPSVAPRG